MAGLHFQGDRATVSISAPGANAVDLCLFDPSGVETRHRLKRNPDGTHHGTVDGVTVGQRYGFRCHGPWQPGAGLWHDPSLLLLDPFSRAIGGDHMAGNDHSRPRTERTSPYSIVVDPPPRPRPGPATAWSDTVIYEAHVRGLTKQHPDIEPELRGTYLGAASPPVIEHLHRLGVTAIELMPVAHHINEPFLVDRGLTNYWGYSTVGWFAPHGGYATADDGRQVGEFAEMVDRFHAAGIEVFLDVVFNHTGEGGGEGPILSFKGLDNPGWYRLDEHHEYVDWTGTGNTVATQRDPVRRAIVSALRWWSRHLGVDGFRFDLAVTLGRGEESFSADNLTWLTGDPLLQHVKLIAEPWDLGPGGYRLGSFGRRWVEWNGRYRDDVRDVWRGRANRRVLATRLAGSDDIYPRPHRSVNLVTAHDGFTLADLVSYDHKHNEANGEGNADGHDDNRSWNSGVEGPTDNPAILERRRQRAGALMSTLLLSLGTPMLLAGDEMGRSQNGNNNAYPLDGPETWLNWSGTSEEFRHLEDVISAAVACRRRHPLVFSATPAEFTWLHPDGSPLDGWNRTGALVAVLGTGRGDELALVMNPTPEAVDLTLDAAWTVEVDSEGRLEPGSPSPPRISPWSVLALGQTI